MKGRLPLVAILGGSLMFLVSLYFTWIAHNEPGCASASGIKAVQCQFAAHTQFKGWDFLPFGQGAAVFAIALAAAALAALVKPHLASRIPLGTAALGLGIFALLSVASLWQLGADNTTAGATAALAPAAYAGLADAAVVVAAAAVMRLGESAYVPSPVTAVGQLLSLGVIASFLLPALNAHEAADWLPASVGLFICAFAGLGMWAWSQPGTQVLRLAVAAAIATLVAGYRPEGVPAYDMWLLVACTAALLALSLLAGRGLRPHRPATSDIVVVAAGVLLLVSLFLPWQAYCSGCLSQSGWEEGSFAGPCVLVLLVALVSFRRFLSEFAIGTAIFVAAMYGSNLRYGTAIGFVAAAVLLVFTLLQLLPVPERRLYVRLVPATAALALLAFVLAPLYRQSSHFAAQSPWRWLGLLAAIATVGTVRLLVRWSVQPLDSGEIVLLPLGLLVLTVLDVIYVGTTRGYGIYIAGTTRYGGGIGWAGWVSLGLCLVLLSLGWVERYGGLPEIRRSTRSQPPRTDGSDSITSLAMRP